MSSFVGAARSRSTPIWPCAAIAINAAARASLREIEPVIPAGTTGAPRSFASTGCARSISSCIAVRPAISARWRGPDYRAAAGCSSTGSVESATASASSRSSTTAQRPCGVSTSSLRGTLLRPRDHQVVVLLGIGIAEPERQLVMRVLLPQLHELRAGVLVVDDEVWAREVAVRDLFEAGGLRVARRNARRVGDHPRDVLEEIVADLAEVVVPEQEARGLRHHRDLALRGQVLEHPVVGLHVRVVAVRADVAR